MKAVALSISAAVILAGLASAQELPETEQVSTSPAATPAPAAAAAPTPAPLVELKTKSSFVAEEVARNPFWPIGYVPATRTDVAERAGPEIPVTAFNVSSITMDPVTRLAIINGKIMEEGQQFGLALGGQTFQLTVKSIQDGQVVLLRRDQQIVVPLKRK